MPGGWGGMQQHCQFLNTFHRCLNSSFRYSYSHKMPHVPMRTLHPVPNWWFPHTQTGFCAFTIAAEVSDTEQRKRGSYVAVFPTGFCPTVLIKHQQKRRTKQFSRCMETHFTEEGPPQKKPLHGPQPVLTSLQIYRAATLKVGPELELISRW